MIESWLAQAHVPTARKQPLPHQHEALDALLPALLEHDRVTGIMACATGKTLVALWIAERTQSQTILVLLPSLALLRQTLHEWLHETNLASLAYLCVIKILLDCSFSRQQHVPVVQWKCAPMQSKGNARHAHERSGDA